MTPIEFKMFVEGLVAGAGESLNATQLAALKKALGEVDMPGTPPNDGKTYPLPYVPPVPYAPWAPLGVPHTGDPLPVYQPFTITCGSA